MATNHSRQQWHETEIGFDRNGRIVALVDHFIAVMGAYIRTHGVVVPERLIDIAAQRLGVDALELRRRNFITPAEMPYDVGGASLSQRTVYDCGDYASALDHALGALGYEDARKEQAEARRQGRLVGIGI